MQVVGQINAVAALDPEFGWAAEPVWRCRGEKNVCISRELNSDYPIVELVA
jgi:hypothetical protein